MITGKEDICQAYQQQDLAEDYLASRYEQNPFGRSLHECQARILERVFTAHRVHRLLEVAPGPARLTVHAPRVEFACALEQSPAMLRIARTRLRAQGGEHWRLLRGDAFRLPFPEGWFDLAMSFKLIRHFPKAERLALLAEFRRVLSPDGLVLIDVVNDPAYRWLLAKWSVTGSWVDDHWFTERSFADEMAEAGFRVVKMYHVQSCLKLQYYLWSYLWKTFPAAASSASRALNRLTARFPNEWIALCRRG